MSTRSCPANWSAEPGVLAHPPECGDPEVTPGLLNPSQKASARVCRTPSNCFWAILGNARREPWEIWHSWQRGICKLQILGAYRGFESHPHRLAWPFILRDLQTGVEWFGVMPPTTATLSRPEDHPRCAHLAGCETSCPESTLASRHCGEPVERSLYAVGERSLFHTLRNAPSVMGRAPAKRKTISPTMRSHSSLW